MPTAVVLGANGQDGSYLAEHLVGRGFGVVGIGRQERSRYLPEGDGFTYRRIDLAKGNEELALALRDIAPDRIYHFAAVHGASGFSYEPIGRDVLRVNVESVHATLEYIREQAPACRLLFASSLKVFGVEPPPVVHEGQQRFSTCLYSISKNASDDLISYYRKHHGVRASVIYFLNHESPRRGPWFFIPRLAAALASAMRGEEPTELRSLDFWCDWGSSLEFMQFSERLLECDRNEDYVMASGKTWSGRGLVATIFALADLDWRDHIRVQSSSPLSTESQFRADLSRMREAIGDAPSLSAVDVVRWILSETHGIILPS